MTFSKRIFYIAVLLVIFAALFGACAARTAGPAETATTPPPDTEVRIVIFHMNDIHAKINDFDKIAWRLEEERKKHSNVYFLNAGDNFSGNAVVDQYEPKGEPMLKLLELTKTDVLALGNHDFDYGQPILKKAMLDASYPMICANVTTPKTGDNSKLIPQPKPYVILKTAEGVRIAVLGLIEVDPDTGIPSSHPDKVKGLTFTNGIETAKKYRRLKKESDVFIALSHMGYDEDKILAQEMGELDLVIGGHSHTTLKTPEDINGVMVAQAGGYARFLGRIELTVKNGKVTSKKGELIPVRPMTGENPEIKALIKKYNNNPRMNEVIATLPVKLEGKSQLGNLITDAIRKVHQLDFALQNDGGIRYSWLGPDVRLKNIFGMLPFGNVIIKFRMTLDELKSLIIYSYGKYKKFDLRASGFRYTVLLDARKKVKDVELTDETGQPLDASKTYTVGVNNYVAASYKFQHTDPGQSLDAIISETVVQYLKQGGDIYKGLDKPRIFEKGAH